MTNVRICFSVMEGQSTNQSKTLGANAPVMTLSDKKVYRWSSNEIKTLAEPFASEALAADARLSEVSRS